MDYKSLMGYGKKKKISKEEIKPQKNTVLENIKKELKLQEDSLGDAFHRKIKAYQDRITKEKEAYKKARERQKKLKNEGPSYEYKKHSKKIDKSLKELQKNFLDFYENLRKKGLNDEAADFLDNYKKNVVGFTKQYKKDFGKLL